MKSPLECTYTGYARDVLRFIFERRQITRKSLTELTGLSALTIAKMVTGMIEDGTIMETDAEQSEKGRKPLLLGIRPDFAYVIGVDIGSYSVKMGVVNFCGELISKQVFTLPSTELAAPANIVSFPELQRHIESIIAQRGSERLLGIGIGISGLVDFSSQTIVYCPNVDGYNNLPISALLQERFGVNTVVDTSARCMALGEKYFGKTGFFNDLSFVTVGHSVAVGTIIENRIFRGAKGFASELGHVKTDKGDDRGACTCGSYGCIELYVTLPMIRMALQGQMEGFHGYSILKEIKDANNSFTYDDVAKAAQAGDKLTMNVLGEAVEHLSTVLSDYINLYNPTLMVLGGGFFDFFPFMLPSIESCIQRKSLTPSLQDLKICCSKLAEDSAVIGSAMQLIQNYFI